MSEEKWNKYYVNNDYVLAILRELKIAENKNEILAPLMKKLNYLVQSRIKGYRNKNVYTDLLQEGRIGLLKAIEDFDETRGPNFFKFACWHIQHKIRMYLKWDKKIYKEINEDTFQSYEYEESSQDKYERQETKQVILKELDNLPNIEKKVLIMRFGIYDSDTYCFREIGEHVSLSKQRIEQIEKHALNKLKNNEEIQNMREI